MMILALERDVPGADPAKFAPRLAAEAQAVWQLSQEGTIREIYFRRDRKAAVLLLECGTPEAARKVLASLPLAREGLIDFEIIALRPYDGFARLFSD